MALVSLQVNQLRNIHELSAGFSPEINLLYGQNGSGKTTVLEAIHLLAIGRSFRTTSVNHAITHGVEAAAIHGEAMSSASQHPVSLKMLKYRAKRPEFYLGQHPAASVAELAQHLPVQLLNLDGYQLLAAPPEARRKFLDWMMFHVEHSFFGLWQDFQKVLRQRNALLKGYGERGQLPYWTERLGELGQTLHELRETTLTKWVAGSIEALREAPGVTDLRIDYDPGWSFDGTYTHYLYATTHQDLAYGYTAGGPHRSDVKIMLGENPARHVLSTGQQKTFVSSLQLAQCEWVSEQTQKVPILLVDDLPSELDLNARKWLMKQLVTTPSQVFLTSVDPDGFEMISKQKNHKMFHVEHGKMQEVV